MKPEIVYFDIHGRYTDCEESAYSMCEKLPCDYRFYVKSKGWFGRIKWKFHHQSNTFGGWMWPEGMPPRGDGVDSADVCLDHAEKIGSDWFKRKGGYLG